MIVTSKSSDTSNREKTGTAEKPTAAWPQATVPAERPDTVRTAAIAVTPATAAEIRCNLLLWSKPDKFMTHTFPILSLFSLI